MKAMEITDIEKADSCLDSFLHTEQAKAAVCTECNQVHLSPVDFSEVKIALAFICKEVRRDNQAYTQTIE